MADLRATLVYRKLYTLLLRLYPEAFRARFSESMEQSFHDLCRERHTDGKSLFGYALGLYAETFAGILRERIALIMPSRKSLIRLAIITVAFLAVPLVVMRFSDEVNWSSLDFVVAGALVFGTGLAFEMVAGRMRGTAYRFATGLALITGFLLIWMNLAVGIIGSENNPANALYLGVLAIGGVGAAIARFRPQGMSRAMFVTAAAQGLVPLVAMLIFRRDIEGEGAVTGLVGVFFLNSAFALMFIGSAALFRQASSPAAGSTARPAVSE